MPALQGRNGQTALPDRQGACCWILTFPMHPTPCHRVWDMASGTETHKLEGHDAPVRSVAISPDSQTVVSGSDDTTVR